MSTTEARASDAGAPMDVARVVRLWSPLAASWLLMAAELPLLNMAVARLPDPKVHLAAYGAIVFPVSLVIEGPIIMLLAAATALCADMRSYRQVKRFMTAAGAALTAVHVAVAFTPLYDVVARDLLGAPEAILEPGRLGLMIMTPWTWSIAYRRFHQGVMIRHGHSREVGFGTVVRLCANAAVLLAGSLHGGIPGIVVGASATATGVLTEAAYIGWRVRPVLRDRVAPAPPAGEPLDLRSFLRFYVPLAVTPLITLAIQPLGAAAMNRMPRALDSVACWPAMHGLLFLTRSVGMAYNEVVVSLVGEPGAVPVLRRFQTLLALGTMGVLALMAATPLAAIWFGDVQGLPPEMADLCRVGVAIAVLMPGYAVLQSWYQGVLVRARATRPVTTAVVLYFVVAGALLLLGDRLQAMPGLWWALASFTIAGVLQTTYLGLRARHAVRAFAAA
ncbi:MAG: hypothetical protein H6825_13715 [Planctomycetes bacterium]|nr:hypothetical protein [Planctomycetota bacterium]